MAWLDLFKKVNINQDGSVSTVTTEKKAKKTVKAEAKKTTEAKCFNGICKTINELEEQLDEYIDKYPESAKLMKLKRKIKVLV